MKSKLNRRNFATLLAATPVALAQTQQAPQQAPQQTPPAGAPNPNTSVPPRRGLPPEIPPFQAPLEYKRQDVAAKIQPFPLSQVRLSASPFQEAQEWNRGYMNRLSADRLLYNFRENAGLPVGSAQPFGGWEAKNDGQRGTELRGHFTGHYLTAAAQLAASGDKEAKAKGDEMVDELAKCQEKLGGGYLSAFPRTFWDRLAARERVWAPFYTIHKIMAGLLDMHQVAGNKQALTVLQGMAGWADEWTKSKTEEHMQRILETEYGGIGETLYNMVPVTGNDDWGKAGDRYSKKVFLNPLASRRDELRGLHVNTHIPQVIAAARRYEISGDMRFHDVADYFFWEVSTARSYVTTGTSAGESWQGQPRQLAWELKRSVATAECCCAYNMLKLARHLYSWTADPRYFDYYERSMFNHRLGTIQPKTGYTQYYLSLMPGAWKTFNSEDKSFWCCTGSGVEEFSKLPDSIYWHDDDGVYVNLFMPSELNWAERGFRLKQDTKFPEEASTTLVVSAAKPNKMALRLRIPEWVASSPTVKINGRVLEATAEPSSYLTISRIWKAGDRIEMTLPMKLRSVAMPDDPSLQAFTYGPIVLAGDLGSEGLTEAMMVGPNAPRLNQAPKMEIPEFKNAGSEPESWIKPASGALNFHTTGQTKDVALAPISSIFGKRYSVYWKVEGCACG